jgi:cytochrome P450
LTQFNPDGDEYSRELDELGFAIYKATPGITRLEAARKATQMAKKIQSRVTKVTEEARSVKAQQSDQGITSRVSSRGASPDVPGEDASPEEIETWLKARGQW